MTTPVPFTSSELRTLTALAGATSLRMFGLFVLLPVVAPHVLAHPAGTAELAGLAVGIYGLTQAIMLVPLGWLSDRLGRKPVLLLGLLLFALGGFLGGSVDHPVSIIIGRILQGLGAISAVVLATVGDVTKEANTVKGMALVGVGIAAAFGLAMILAGPLAASIGIPGILFVTGGLALVACGVIAVTKLPPLPQLSAEQKVKKNLVGVDIWPLCAGVFGLHFAMASVFVVLPIRLVALVEFTALWQVYLVAFGIAGVLVAPLIMTKSNDPKLFYAAIGLVGLGSVSLLVSSQLGVVAIGLLLVIFFLGFNFLEAVLPAKAAKLAVPGARGATMGLYSIAQALGIFLGGWLAGLGLGWI